MTLFATYERLAGQAPHCRPWHFQWLAIHQQNRALKAILEGVAPSAMVLDVGCGAQPYRRWLRTRYYLGLEKGDKFPMIKPSADVLLSTQCLEHVDDLSALGNEIQSALKPGGMMIVAVPFLYNEHAPPDDYRRWTIHGLRQWLEGLGLTVTRVETFGGIGSLIGLMLLNWLFLSWPRLGLWVALAPVVNLLAVAVDQLDRTDAFYHDLLMLAAKPAEAPR